jgi:AcrR family transcriptional regulator
MRPPKPEQRGKATEVTSDRRRSDLLGAAFEVIAEKGLEGLRTRDVASRAGVNISTLHYYFGTKEALIEALVQYVAEKFADEGEPRTRQPVTLRDHFERAWATFQKNPRLAMVLQELALRAQRDKVTRAAFQNLFKFWNLQVASVVQEEIGAGVLRADVDPNDIAFVVTSFIMGAMTQLGVNPRAFEFRALSRQVGRLLASGR